MTTWIELLEPDARFTYTPPFIDMAFVDTVRCWAEVTAAAAVGFSADPRIELRYSLGLTDDALMWTDIAALMWTDATGTLWQGWSDWQAWTVGEVEAELIQFRLVRPVADGDLTISQFTPVVDVPPRSESARGVAVGSGGASILYARPFHLVPVVQATITSGGMVAIVSNDTALGFDVDLYNLSGAPVAGTINWTASTE